MELGAGEGAEMEEEEGTEDGIEPPTMEAQDLGLAGVRRVERGMGVLVAGGGGGVGLDVTAEVIAGAGKTFVVLVVGDVVLLVLAEAVISEGVVAVGGCAVSDNEDGCPELEAKLA